MLILPLFWTQCKYLQRMVCQTLYRLATGGSAVATIERIKGKWLVTWIELIPNRLGCKERYVF